jgi:hypothetical protein
MTNADSLPRQFATTEQVDKLKTLIREQYPTYNNEMLYATLSGILTVGVERDAMERLIFLNTK